MMFLRIFFSALAMLGIAGTASAQEWPARNLRIIVPFPAGGSFDTQARVIADELSKSLGRAVVVDNKPGAGGTIGATEAARAAPDGYTLFMGSNGTQAANVFLFSKLAYDPEKDFDPLTREHQCQAHAPNAKRRRLHVVQTVRMSASPPS